MALRAKKPEVKEARLKALMYANTGAGKTHFCCSIPDTYYIDTEGLEDYPHLVNMLKSNGGELVYLNELSEIIKEVQALLGTKHKFKTLIIDSISFPYAKAKRLTFQLGILLSRLDMNVIVIAHEKSKFVDNKDAGKTFDITDKLAYSLGAVLNLRLQGEFRKLFIEKSRYSQLKTGKSLDFDEGYSIIKELFGEGIFVREVKPEPFATKEQIAELNRLIALMKVSDETVAKLLTNAKATTMEEMSEAFAQRAIDKLLLNLKGEEAA